MKEKILRDFSLLGYYHHNYGIDQHSPCGMWEFEVEALIDAALSVPYGNFVEFGAYYGASSCILGKCLYYKNPSFRLHSVDINHIIHWYRFVKRRARLNNIVVHDTKSCDYQHDGSPVALALSDSWHDFKTVLAEFRKVEPYMVDGGVFAVHDCEPDIYSNLDFYRDRYKKNWQSLSVGQYNSVDSANKGAYHQAENSQDFEHGAAIAYILDNYPYELVQFGPQNYPSMERITGPFQRGKVSPVSSLVFLRKKNV